MNTERKRLTRGAAALLGRLQEGPAAPAELLTLTTDPGVVRRWVGQLVTAGIRVGRDRSGRYYLGGTGSLFAPEELRA